MRAPSIDSPSPHGLKGARLRSAATILAIVLALHLLALRTLSAGAGGGHEETVRPVLQVRQIRVDAPAPQEAAGDPLPAPLPAPPTDAAAAAPILPLTAPPVVETLPSEPEAAPAPAAQGGGEQVPVYATTLPPATVVQYELRRRAQPGQAQLTWRPDPDGTYIMTMEGQIFDSRVFHWRSEGRTDTIGLAPDRYLVTRGRRGAQAANFQRETGKITFSGPAIDYPWFPGAQDRLSWWVQLAGILEASPALRTEASEVVLFVVGTQGDAALWTFRVQGREPIDVPAGLVADALYLKRTSRGPYDNNVEVWLDPARAHWPVRARLSTVETGDFTEFLMK